MRTANRIIDGINLKDYYPDDRYNLVILKDPNEITRLLNSKSSTTWGAGQITNTNIYQLAVLSPSDKGKIVTAIITDARLVNKT